MRGQCHTCSNIDARIQIPDRKLSGQSLPVLKNNSEEKKTLQNFNQISQLNSSYSVKVFQPLNIL